MMTRIFKHAIAFVFRNHIRWVVMALTMVLVIAAILTPPAVVSQTDIPVPTNLMVTGVSNGNIQLSWSSLGSVHLIERSESMSGPFEVKTPVSGTSFTDTTVSSLKSYVYRVRRVGATGGFSAPSNIAVGTAISFANNEWDNKPITAQSFSDVRKAINAMRDAANLPPAVWARDPLPGLKVNAGDLEELRDRLEEALINFEIDLPSYTDPDLFIGGTKIRANHIEELQVASTRGRSRSAGPLYGSVSRSVGGEFEPNAVPLPLVPVHLSVLPNKKILFWGRDLFVENGTVKHVVGKSQAYVWDMATNPGDGTQSTPVPNPFTNVFCSGHSFMPDGNLFVTGGHKDEINDAIGEDETNIFNYNDNTWTEGPRMNNGRWYPYNVTLGTGEPLTMAGYYLSDDPTAPIKINFVPQVYTPGAGGQLKNLAEPDPLRLTQYPYLHLLSNGRVFQAQSDFFYEYVAGVRTKRDVEKQSRTLDPKTNDWDDLASTLFPHAQGSSVLLGDDDVMILGGFDDTTTPTRNVERIDLGAPVWKPLTPMNFPRAHHTATLLPDGKVLVTGGAGCAGGNNFEAMQGSELKCSAGQIQTPELWDPATGKWTKMAPHKEARAYHSIAALLPDGRVLVGGGGLPGAVGEIGSGGTPITASEALDRHPNAWIFGHKNVEIYSPPYFFDQFGNKAAQPIITSAPSNVVYGDPFDITTSGATGTNPTVVLMRLPSVTHGFNQDQRRVVLARTLTSGGINVTAPADSNKCPPGYYMLFVLNAAGVPSEARMIRVQNKHLFPKEVPDSTASGQGSTWEQGVEFSSSVTGFVTHIRFWKAPGEPSGGHVGRLWSAGGVPLASVNFGPETASGWQVAELQPHFQITAGVKYKVTYNIHSVVAKTFNVFCNSVGAFCSPVTSGPLVSWGSSFSTPAGSFPATPSTSNLFADIIFKSQ